MTNNKDNKKPILWVIVGANGAGKSTFYNDNLSGLGLPFVNADNIAKEENPNNPEAYSYIAAQKANEMRSEYLAEHKSFAFETVFSHDSKVDFLREAKEEGYDISLVFIHLPDVQLNKLRVQQRVLEGGHNVPHEKIESRQPRTLANVEKALEIVDTLYVLDNSSFKDPHKLVAKFESGSLVLSGEKEPEWLADIFPRHFSKMDENELQEPFKVSEIERNSRFSNFYGRVNTINKTTPANDDFSLD